jgi:hypothetical protein
MVDDIGRPALREGHVEGLEHQLGAEMRRHRPADDPPTPRIEDHGEVEEAPHVGM